MKKLGCLFVILGIVLFSIGSAFLFQVLKSYDGQLLTSLPLKVSAQSAGEWVTAPKDPHYEVRLTFVHKSHEEHPHFRFPVSYRILDEKGTTIFSEEVVADPDGARPWSMISVSRGAAPESTSAEAEFTFGHFATEAPRKLRVEAEIKPDPQTREEPIEPQLRIYYQVAQGTPDHAWLFLSLGGCGLVVVGLIVLIAGFFIRKRPVMAPHK